MTWRRAGAGRSPHHSARGPRLFLRACRSKWSRVQCWQRSCVWTSPPVGDLERSVTDLLDELTSAAVSFGGQPLNGAGGPAFLFPAAGESMFESAARAALAMLDRWRGWIAVCRGRIATDAPLRLGLNVGFVYRHQGEGSGAFRGGCLAGAESLARAAQPGTVLVSESISRYLTRSFDLVAVDPASVRIVELPDQPFMLIGEKAASPQDAPTGFAFPFVGRHEELALLRRHLNEARRGLLRVVHLVGEPGAGKSRLIEEFTRQAGLSGDLEGMANIRTCAVPYGGGLLHSLRSALSGVSRAEGDSGGFAQELQRFGLREAHQRMLMDTATGVGTAASRPRDLAEAVGAVLRAFAEARGLLLVLDDLHWADDLSLDVWRHALDEVRARALVILSYRPSCQREVGSWGGKMRTVVRLAPLSEEDLATIGSAIAGSGFEAVDQREAISRCGGNPLYLEHALGLLSDRRQAGRAQTSLPETLHGVILARLRLLADTAASLSRPGSPWMGDAPWERSAALAELEKLEIQMGRWLDRLESWTREGREEIAGHVDLLEQVDFSLTLAAMRLGVPRARRRRLPRSIERLLDGSSREHLARLEQELAAGRDGINTAIRAERAASRLLALGRAGEAAAFYALAIRAAESEGVGSSWGAGHLRERRGDALWEAGDGRGAALCYEAALEALGHSDEGRLRLRIKAAAARREAGDNDLARGHLEAAGDAADARIERALLALAEGDLRLSRREADLVLVAQPSSWRAHAVLARLGAQGVDRVDAVHHLRTMLEGCLVLRTRHERQEVLAALESCGLSPTGALARAASRR